MADSCDRLSVQWSLLETFFIFHVRCVRSQLFFDVSCVRSQVLVLVVTTEVLPRSEDGHESTIDHLSVQEFGAVAA